MTDIKHTIETTIMKFIIKHYPDMLEMNALSLHCDNCELKD